MTRSISFPKSFIFSIASELIRKRFLEPSISIRNVFNRIAKNSGELGIDIFVVAIIWNQSYPNRRFFHKCPKLFLTFPQCCFRPLAIRDVPHVFNYCLFSFSDIFWGTDYRNHFTMIVLYSFSRCDVVLITFRSWNTDFNCFGFTRSASMAWTISRIPHQYSPH